MSLGFRCIGEGTACAGTLNLDRDSVREKRDGCLVNRLPSSFPFCTSRELGERERSPFDFYSFSHKHAEQSGQGGQHRSSTNISLVLPSSQQRRNATASLNGCEATRPETPVAPASSGTAEEDTEPSDRDPGHGNRTPITYILFLLFFSCDGRKVGGGGGGSHLVGCLENSETAKRKDDLFAD